MARGPTRRPSARGAEGRGLSSAQDSWEPCVLSISSCSVDLLVLCGSRGGTARCHCDGEGFTAPDLYGNRQANRMVLGRDGLAMQAAAESRLLPPPCDADDPSREHLNAFVLGHYAGAWAMEKGAHRPGVPGQVVKQQTGRLPIGCVPQSRKLTPMLSATSNSGASARPNCAAGA